MAFAAPCAFVVARSPPGERVKFGRDSIKVKDEEETLGCGRLKPDGEEGSRCGRLGTFDEVHGGRKGFGAWTQPCWTTKPHLVSALR